jgi:hypothetical protein
MGDGSFTEPWADCRFYYTSKRFARDHLLPAYFQSDDNAHVTCEYHIYEALDRNIKVHRGHRPFITGYAGATGEAYFDSSLGSLDYNFPCWVTQR